MSALRAASSWLASPESDFSIQNLPYGIFSAPGKNPRVGVAIGEQVVDLLELAAVGAFDGVANLDAKGCFGAATLNAFMGCERPVWQAVRAKLTALLSEPPADPSLKDADAALQGKVLVPLTSVTMHLPAQIGE